MRSELGILIATALFLIAGHGILLGLGLTSLRARPLLASSGLAYLTGAAGTLLPAIALLAAGGTLTLPVFAALSLVLGAVGAALAWRRRSPEPPVPEGGGGPTRAEAVLIGLALLALAACLIVGLLDAGARPLADWDSWSIWTRKAAVLTSAGLDERIFAGAPYGFMHLDYPIFLPLFEAVHFRAMKGLDVEAIHAALWIFFVAGLGAIAYIGSRLTRIWVWLPVVLAVALGSRFYSHLLTAYADVPLGILLALGVLCIGAWLWGLDWRYLVLGALFLAAAASTKNEGVLDAAVVIGAAAVVLVAQREWRSLRALAIGALGVLIAVAPWLIWTLSNDVPRSLPIGKGLDPGYVGDNWERVTPTFKALAPNFEAGALGYVVPIALVLVLAALATRGLRRLGAFYLLAGIGTLLSIVWAFVITPAGLDWQIATSADRVIMGFAFVAVAAAVQLGGLLDAHRSEPAGADA